MAATTRRWSAALASEVPPLLGQRSRHSRLQRRHVRLCNEVISRRRGRYRRQRSAEDLPHAVSAQEGRSAPRHHVFRRARPHLRVRRPERRGKTTTIRTLMGLIRPTSGSATILGHAIPSRAARFKVGFLPESRTFYDYLTIGELLDLAGRLFGIDAALRKKRADDLIERVGLGRARGAELEEVLERHAAARRARTGVDERSRGGRPRRAGRAGSIRSAAKRFAI